MLQARALVTEETDTEEVISGNGPLSVRARPSSPKRDCARRTTSTGGRAPANVHAKSRLTLEPLRTLRPETKGQAEPARTGRGPSPAPCGQSLHIVVAQLAEHLPQVGVHGVRRDVQPLATAFLKRAVADRRAGYEAIPCKLRAVTGQISGQLGGVAYALQAHAPEMPRTAINGQRSAPAATSEPEADAGFEPASNAW